MSFGRRHDRPAGDWRLRYAVPGMAEPVTEVFATKTLARERLGVVMQFKGLSLLEMRDPFGRIWFRDHFFASAGEVSPH